MDMKRNLLVLSVFLVFTRGHGDLQVSLFPGFPPLRLYVADEVTLRCKENKNILTQNVEWYKNNNKIITGNATLHIPAATVNDSGEYRCEQGGKKSPDVTITVLDMVPQVSLTLLKKEKSVLSKGNAAFLELYVKGGLENWSCRFTEDGIEYSQQLPANISHDRVIIHAEVGVKNGRTYWCLNTKMKKEERHRSNAVKLTATEHMVMLQVPERPVWLGDKVTLSCDIWGNPQVETAVFYKDGQQIEPSGMSYQNQMYVISNISTSSAGSYSCNAAYKFYQIDKNAEQHKYSSDEQVLRVIAGPPKAKLNCGTWSCECPLCSNPDSVRWYFTPYGQTVTQIIEESNFKKGYGKYFCSTKWKDTGLSRPSNTCDYEAIPETNWLLWMVVVFLLLIIMFVLLVVYFRKRRYKKASIEDGADGGYEEIASKKKEDETGGGYELLKLKKEDQDKSQYETLKGAGKAQEEGHYEPLKKGETQVYQTLKEQGKAQGGGEYEALKKSDPEGGIYHTLKEQGQAKGEGEYEALKTTQAEVYQTLGQGEEAGAVEGPMAQENPNEELKPETKQSDSQ